MESNTRAERFRLARTKYNRHGEEGLRAVSEKSGISQSLIWDLEANTQDRAVDYRKIVKLAEYYGVNVSWLLGQSDSYSLDEDNQMVTQVTGLSADAVSILCGLRGDQRKIDCLNLLLTSSHFNRALTMLSLAKRISDSNSQDDKMADLIEELNYSGINEGMKPENSAVSNRQLIRMYRNDALLDVGNAFRKIAPADNEERKEN